MDKPLPTLSDPESLARMRRERQKIAAWLETRRGKPQYRAAPPAGRAVARVVKPLSKKFGGSSSALRLLPHWPNIIGEKWAKFSKPEKFIGSKDGKTLVISAPGPAGSLIMASARRIIERTNIYMGEGAVKSIKVVQTKMASPVSASAHLAKRAGPSNPHIQRGLTPSEEESLQVGLAPVKEEPLKTALCALGRHVISQNK